jgi:hypothetical protein
MLQTMTNPEASSARHANLVARRWNRIAVGIAMLTGLAAVLLPLGTSSSADSNGVATSRHVSLLTTEGRSVLLIVAIPVVLVALPLLFRRGPASYRARVVIVVLLTILVLLGAMSIGLFFIPTLAAMIASMSAQSRAYDRPNPSSTVAAGHG